ncbi:adenosylcobinamide-GDP ribazoletransferase [Methanocella arvoryzae]|uniref:Adenosylcobinamide-GDP ribazoletransferase n=1 Tax=Methanocella arvoryzae (strain DSM 22066 / NBRC 105507 / MRE50) TaxID=351160 RepID=COBS_METAR|nr:adenosylcobinamide-GDP ribazoletransferase [Methanocella arvoryzae]Q0W1P5.1 RecName: Full=Adenosylcobinamide-GDP ribazoletransferase; AltName: Full=Cobalamin synthase; AltName: Full=Cobalamin-5'-phosphate synthase [Methanocella arvoryzae MRE50]CAJ37698.1 cobalamin-5-phosphate synthase [Methanocella arvoryzae MRE50]
MAGNLLNGLRAAIAFLTTLPVRIVDGDYDAFADRQYLFIPVAIVTGLLLGVAGTLFQCILPAPFAAVLTVACIFLLTGINHLDGLSDFGDGLIASGPREKKVRAMKDVHAGAGGLLFMAMDLLFLFALAMTFAGSPTWLFVPLLVAEGCAKVAQITIIAFGKSAHEGMGSYMIARMKKEHYLAAVIGAWIAIGIAIIGAAIIPGGGNPLRVIMAGGLAMLSPLAVALIILIISDRNFGGVNGDVIGAANEIARIAALGVMGAVLWMRF